MRHFIFIHLIILTLLGSCNNPKKLDYTVIEINADSSEIFEIPASSKVIHLKDKNSDSSLIIGDVYKLDFCSDTIIIFSKERVIAVDSNGNYLHDFSTKGRGPLEYINLNSVYINNGLVHLYDSETKTILRYYINGSFCDSIGIPANKHNLAINRIISF